MGWSELLIVVVVAIVLIGPRDLLPMLKVVIQQIYSLRRMVYDAQSQFEDMLSDVEFDAVKGCPDDTLDVELAPAGIRMETSSDDGVVGRRVDAVTASDPQIAAEEMRQISSSSHEKLLVDLASKRDPQA